MAGTFTALDVRFKNGSTNTYPAAETDTHYYFNDDRFYRCLINLTRPQIWMSERLNWVEYEGITNITKTDLGSVPIIDSSTGAVTNLTDIVQAIQTTAKTITTFYENYKAYKLLTDSRLSTILDSVDTLTDVLTDVDNRVTQNERDINGLDVRVTALENK